MNFYSTAPTELIFILLAVISRMYYNVPCLLCLLSDSQHDAGLLLLELSSRITTVDLICNEVIEIMGIE